MLRLALRVQRARGSCGSLEGAPSKRRKTVVKDWFLHEARARAVAGKTEQAGVMGACDLCGSASGEKATLNVQNRTDLRKSAWKHVEKQGVHWTPSRRGATGSWWRDADGARSVARRARFVHRRRADRLKMAEEREDWIFSLRAWPRPSRLGRRRSRQSHGQSRRRVFRTGANSFICRNTEKLTRSRHGEN